MSLSGDYVHDITELQWQISGLKQAIADHLDAREALENTSIYSWKDGDQRIEALNATLAKLREVAGHD